MTKEKPEIGDVFEYEKKKAHLIMKPGKKLGLFIVKEGEKIWMSACPIDDDLIYTGKSKVNFNELFEVKKIIHKKIKKTKKN